MKVILFKQPIFPVKRFLYSINILIILFIASHCTTNTQVETSNEIAEIRIVPVPSKILYKRDYFNLDKSTRILLNLSDEKSKKAAESLIDKIVQKTEYKLKIADRFTTTKIPTGIELIVGQNKHIKQEGFKIVISRNRIKILANDSNGLYYAINVIIGLLHKKNDAWRANQISIEDHPKTNFRGIYLNFPDSILDNSKLIELLEINRINYLITSKNWASPNGFNINIGDTSLLSGNWRQNLIDTKNIKEFYLTPNNSNKMILYTINNSALLHPDSIAILGEAMWSKQSNLNYQNLVDHLEFKSKPELDLRNVIRK